MKELELQSMVVNLVKSRGGYAHKRSHKFLAGIADLLIKIPEHPAFIVEVKQRLLDASRIQTPILNDVTALQKKDLRDAQAAGMNAAVMSFLQTKSGMRSLYVGTFMVDDLDKAGYAVDTGQYAFIGSPMSRDIRERLLWAQLLEVAQWHRN